MDRYEIQVRSLASQTFCSTLMGVASFSVGGRRKCGEGECVSVGGRGASLGGEGLTGYADHDLVFPCVAGIVGYRGVVSQKGLLAAV